MSEPAETWVMVVYATNDPVEIAAMALTPERHREASSYLVSYDPDAYDGAGDIVLTDTIAFAKTFASLGEVMEEWRRTSTMHPVRLNDGKPNRPLTAYSINPKRVERTG